MQEIAVNEYRRQVRKNWILRRQCKYIGIALVLEYNVHKRDRSSPRQRLKYDHFQKALNRKSLCRIS
jgi:hypothetical protein